MKPRPVLTALCPAKLNLFLHVTGRRPDGYHELQTVFQLLDYGDSMQFRTRDDGELHLQCSDRRLEGEDNLALKAARALRDMAGRPELGADIFLEKRIPAGAGLGGGSSNAATTLLALNRLWSLELDRTALAEAGLRLGADVPVFVHGRSAWASGIGEQLSPVTLPARWFVVLTPPCHVSTAAIFSHRELTRNGSAIKMAAFLAGHSRNDCESLVRRLYPAVDSALSELGRRGQCEARMTGTGASVFAAFGEQARANAVLRQVMGHADGLLEGLQGFVARGIDRAPAPEEQTRPSDEG